MNWPHIPRDRVGVALLTANAVLFGMVMVWLVSPPQPKIPSAQPVHLSEVLEDKLGSPAAADASLADTYTLMIGQPLFNQDRKYTPPAAVDVTVTQSPAPDFFVTGYLEIPGRPAKGYLRERAGGRSLTVSTGDSVDGWMVVGLAPKQIRLRQGDRIVELSRGNASILGSVDHAAPFQANASASPGVSTQSQPMTVENPSTMPSGQPSNAPTSAKALSGHALPMSVAATLPASHANVSASMLTAGLGVAANGHQISAEAAPTNSAPPLVIVAPQSPVQTYSPPPSPIPH